MGKNNKPPIIIYICISCVFIILFWGLKPFNFHSANGVEWSKKNDGISFLNRGIVYGPVNFKDSEKIPLSEINDSFSIELWFTPGSAGSGRFACIFGLYNERLSEILSISQVKSYLNLSRYQNPGNKKNTPHRWKWLKNAAPKGQKRFLTITSVKQNTKVYLDGKKVREYRNYSFTPAQELTPAWRIIIGNDPKGKRSWTGKIHGLALYNHSLSPEKIIKHFEKWRDNTVISLLKEKEVIALYPMDEQKGHLIHNVLNNRYNLLIPDRFIILKKNLLKLYDSNLTLKDKNLRDICINILGFIPLGYFLFLVFNLYSQHPKTLAWRLIIPATLGGIVVSLIIETLQVYLPTRHSSITDLIFNSFGTVFGTILALVFIKIKDLTHRTRQSES